MSIGVYGRAARAKEGQYFQATVRQWRPIHDLVLQLCSDLLDADTLEGLGYCDGAGPRDAAVCRTMVNRFEHWMERHVDGHRMASDLRVTPDGQFVSSQRLSQQPDLPTVSPYQVDDAALKRWVEFLRYCGGFVVGGASMALVAEGEDPSIKRWYVWLGSQPLGPLSAERLKQLAARGVVTRETLISRAGEADLACAWRVQGLFPPPTVARRQGKFTDEPVAMNVPPFTERCLADTLLKRNAATRSPARAAIEKTGIGRRRATLGGTIAFLVMLVAMWAPWPSAVKGRIGQRSLEAASRSGDPLAQPNGFDARSAAGDCQIDELACVLGADTIERHVRSTQATHHGPLVSDYVAVYVRQDDRWTLREADVSIRANNKPGNAWRYHVDATGHIYRLDVVPGDHSLGDVQLAVLEMLQHLDCDSSSKDRSSASAFAKEPVANEATTPT